VVGGGERVRLVMQVHLELAGRVFGAGGGDRHVLRACGFVERGMKGGVAVEIVDRIDRVVLVADTGARVERRLRPAGTGALRVDEIEFELERGDRCEAELRKTVERMFERGARLAGGGSTVLVAHGCQHLEPFRALAPDGRDGAGDGPGGAVGIAIAEAAAEGVHHLALHVHQIDGARELHTVLEQAGRIGERQALAADRAGDVDDQGVDAFQIRMGGGQALELGLGQIGESGTGEAREGRCLIHGQYHRRWDCLDKVSCSRLRGGRAAPSFPSKAGRRAT